MNIKKIITNSKAILKDGIKTLLIKVSTTRIKFRYSSFLSFIEFLEFKIFLKIFDKIIFLKL